MSATTLVTAKEYLQRERASDVRHELIDGDMTEMVGGSETHVLVICNLVAALHGLLRQRSERVYASDMRVGIPNADSYTYPDIVVSAGDPQLEDDQQDTLLNPVVLIEVLSPTTEAYDRGRKFEQYRRIPSLQEYVLVAQDRMQVECYRRRADGWHLTEYSTASDSVPFPALQCEVRVEEIYAKVNLSTERPQNDQQRS
ncbi:MAG: Uma2 family endonuclease [Planctomycetaceae bacterium]